MHLTWKLKLQRFDWQCQHYLKKEMTDKQAFDRQVTESSWCESILSVRTRYWNINLKTLLKIYGPTSKAPALFSFSDSVHDLSNMVVMYLMMVQT